MPAIIARVSSTEKAEVKRFALSLDLNESQYIRERCLQHTIRVPRPMLERDALQALNRLGNNLNQLTRLAHNQALPNSDALLATLDRIQAELERVATDLRRERDQA